MPKFNWRLPWKRGPTRYALGKRLKRLVERELDRLGIDWRRLEAALPPAQAIRVDLKDTVGIETELDLENIRRYRADETITSLLGPEYVYARASAK